MADVYAFPPVFLAEESNKESASMMEHGRQTSSARDQSLQAQLQFPSGLDFERVVNEYSIQATRERLFRRKKRQGRKGSEADQSPLLASATTIDPDNERYQTFSSDTNLPPPPPPEQVRVHKYFKGRTTTRWVLIVLTGILTGLASVVVLHCTNAIQLWSATVLDAQWQQQATSKETWRMWTIGVCFVSINLLLSLSAATLCLVVSPDAVGSGIPEVKAYLNGVRVKRFSSLRLLLVKIVATILSVSSGLTLGKEGPSVHIGAIVGASCTKIANILLRLFPNRRDGWMNHWCHDTILSFVATTDLSHFSTDAERRDLVGIGAAAGFAASFGAPIGGLLFALEAASSFYEDRMFLRTLLATSLATFCIAVYHHDLSNYSIISLGEYHTSNENIFFNRIEEIPLYILMGLGGGVMGGVFCRCWKALQSYRQKFFAKKRMQNFWKLSEVAIVSLVTSTLIYCIPLMSWTCQPTTERDTSLNSWKTRQYDCPAGRTNELADIMFGSRLELISSILTDPNQFSPWTLLTVGLLFYPLMTLTIGVSLPSGVYTPTFLVGTALGGFSGQMFQGWFGQELSASTFALLGAAALLVGIQRSTVSHCVILVEGTGQVKILIPVIFTAVIARSVAAWIHEKGLFETGMEVKQFSYLEHHDKKLYDVIRVSQIMSTDPRTLGPRERVHTLVKVLRESSRNGFPVVDSSSGKLYGLVRRDQLVALLECGVFQEPSNGDSLASSGFERRSSATIRDSPLFHMAYHIKDDRYDHLDKETHKPLITKHRVDDSYDENAWLVSVEERLRAQKHSDRNSHKDPGVALGEESLPAVKIPPVEGTDHATCNESARTDSCHGEFAVVSIKDKGAVFVEWMPPEFHNRWVSVASVMNQGTYTVLETAPVSKAYYMFTALGLRHLIVLGGETGGTVVGILTRINFIKEYMEERTGYKM